MALFSKLQRLIPDGRSQLEDFHTEIVAQVLRNSPTLTLTWLSKLGLTDAALPDRGMDVSTQVSLPALDSHQTASRPDICLRICRGDETEIIFIESKVGSKEGGARTSPLPEEENGQLEQKRLTQQLKRYAEQLHEHTSASKRSLIYVTRDFDPKEREGFPIDVKFVTQRWHDFYILLEQQKHHTDLEMELLRFMKENNMDQTNHFDPADIVALSQISSVLKAMDATMSDAVFDRFKSISPNLSSKRISRKTSLIHLEWGGYWMEHWIGGQMQVSLGYWPKGFDGSANYPEVGAEIGVPKGVSARVKIVQAMGSFVAFKGAGWKSYSLDKEAEYAGTVHMQSLQHFLAADDHVKAISDHFILLLNDIAEFKNKYPNLPWTEQSTAKEQE